MIVCGLDPAIRNIGIVIGEVNTLGEMPRILHAETFQTKTQEKKSSTYLEGEYDVLCAKHLTKCISNVLNHWKPQFIAAEIGFGSRSRAAANGLGVAKGIIGSIMAFYPITLMVVEPSEAKLVVIKNAEKEIIQAWVRQNFKYNWTSKKGEFEHQADAVAILVAGMKKYLKEKNNAVSKSSSKAAPKAKLRKKGQVRKRSTKKSKPKKSKPRKSTTKRSTTRRKNSL